MAGAVNLGCVPPLIPVACLGQLTLAMTTDLFYAELPALERFIDITVSANFVAVPDDWYIVATDVVGSTQAIADGQYKAVNFVGAAAIVSLLNVAGSLEIPFVFGGDGASLLIPGSLLPAARQALLANQAIARRDFQLELRVGIIPVAHVTTSRDLLIAKHRVSDNYDQAIFRGGGLTYATDLLKNVATQGLYQLDAANLLPKADLSGLECRWQDIPSRDGDIVTLLVLATAPSDSQTNRIYREVITYINQLYGGDAQINPVLPANLRLSFSQQNLALEAQARAASPHPFSRLRYLLKMRLENLLGLVLMRFGIRTSEVDWGDYKAITAAATDHRKFDDILRMVIPSTPAKTKRLARYLDRKYQDGCLVHGLHISSSALMTCLVFERSGRQVHFIDGSDGGYALAAVAMKQRLKS